MREDIPHPDKRTSLRVVLYTPEDSPETWKGIRFALPLHSQALRGMVWDWRSFHSLVPKVVSFGVSHEEEREYKILARRRELTTDYVVFGGRLRRGCFAPFNPIPDAHTPKEERGEKKIRRQRHKRLTYLYPRDILYMLKGDKVFRLTFEDCLPLFAPPRSTGLVFPVSAGFVNLPANVFSYVSPCCPSAPFVKKTTSQKVDIRRLRWYNKITKSIRGFAPERKVGMSCKCCGCACHEHTTDTDVYMFSEEYAQKMAEISADTEATPVALHGHIVCEVHPDEDIKVLAAELSSLID